MAMLGNNLLSYYKNQAQIEVLVQQYAWLTVTEKQIR
jgi:hypothetical protein